MEMSHVTYAANFFSSARVESTCAENPGLPFFYSTNSNLFHATLSLVDGVGRHPESQYSLQEMSLCGMMGQSILKFIRYSITFVFGIMSQMALERIGERISRGSGHRQRHTAPRSAAVPNDFVDTAKLIGK